MTIESPTTSVDIILSGSNSCLGIVYLGMYVIITITIQFDKVTIIFGGLGACPQVQFIIPKIVVGDSISEPKLASMIPIPFSIVIWSLGILLSVAIINVLVYLLLITFTCVYLMSTRLTKGRDSKNGSQED